jgi:hypothetical protein
LLIDRYKSDNFAPLGLCPGPKQPRDFDSFLLPFLQELRQLGHGVPSYDAHTKTSFLLKAHLVLVTGDTPAISKLFHLNGHSAKLPCQVCYIEGVQYKTPFLYQKGDKKGLPGENTRYYYPVTNPTRSRSMRISVPRFQQSLADIPRRDNESYLGDGYASLADSELAKASGINGVSPLAFLPTISFPSSVPLNLMHLIHLGFARDMCALLSGQYFRSARLNSEQLEAGRGCMTVKDWEALGIDMANIKAPVSWGRYPRNIQKYIKGFKAEELSNFLLHYLLPLSFGRVHDSVYRQLQRLVLILSLATSYELEFQEIEEVETHLMIFSKWFYETYYQYNQDQLPVCKYTIHLLLYLADHLKDWGPTCYYWQYPQVILRH